MWTFMTLQQYCLTYTAERSCMCGQRNVGFVSERTSLCADALMCDVWSVCKQRNKPSLGKSATQFLLSDPISNIYFVFFLSVCRCVEIIAKEGRSLKELYLVSCKITDHGRILSVAVNQQHHYHNHHCRHPQQWSHLILWLGSYETRKQ